REEGGAITQVRDAEGFDIAVDPAAGDERPAKTAPAHDVLRREAAGGSELARDVEDGAGAFVESGEGVHIVVGAAAVRAERGPVLAIPECNVRGRDAAGQSELTTRVQLAAKRHRQRVDGRVDARPQAGPL